VHQLMMTAWQSCAQILYKYERNWSKAAQNNWVWTLMKLAYTQISLQYFGALCTHCQQTVQI